jgi:hypothetical protein
MELSPALSEVGPVLEFGALRIHLRRFGYIVDQFPGNTEHEEAIGTVDPPASGHSGRNDVNISEIGNPIVVIASPVTGNANRRSSMNYDSRICLSGNG